MADPVPHSKNLYLRRARDPDLARLQTLMSIPEIYHYLADGTPPELPVLEAWLVKSHESFDAFGVGLWLLESGEKKCAIPIGARRATT